MKYDNYFIEDLRIVLTKNSVTERYYAPIEYVDYIISILTMNKIITKDDFLRHYEKISKNLNIPADVLEVFHNFVLAYRFRPFPLKKLPSIGLDIIDELADMNIKTTLDVLDNEEYLLKKSKTRYFKAICIAEQGRMCGHRDVRASLYFDCGFQRIKDFDGVSFEQVLIKVDDFIQKNKVNKSLPLPKEVKSSLAWAKIYSNYDKKTRL